MYVIGPIVPFTENRNDGSQHLTSNIFNHHQKISMNFSISDTFCLLKTLDIL